MYLDIYDNDVPFTPAAADQTAERGYIIWEQCLHSLVERGLPQIRNPGRLPRRKHAGRVEPIGEAAITDVPEMR